MRDSSNQHHLCASTCSAHRRPCHMMWKRTHSCERECCATLLARLHVHRRSLISYTRPASQLRSTGGIGIGSLKNAFVSCRLYFFFLCDAGFLLPAPPPPPQRRQFTMTPNKVPAMKTPAGNIGCANKYCTCHGGVSIDQTFGIGISRNHTKSLAKGRQKSV